MKKYDNTIEYHELLMTYNDTSKSLNYNLPDGYHYSFYKPGDEKDWAQIHIESGEFMSIEHGLKHFHDFYDSFIDELPKRCFFVENDKNEKVGTATISLLQNSEYGYDAVVDWFAIKRSYQGKHLAKPMVVYFIKLAHDLGHSKLLLHTQTTSWLAANLYLDCGFEPFKVENDIKGWQILNTITNNPKLKQYGKVSQEKIYSPLALGIVKELNKLYSDDYDFAFWDKKGRNDIEVNHHGQLDKYQYYFIDNQLILENSLRKEND